MFPFYTRRCARTQFQNILHIRTTNAPRVFNGNIAHNKGFAPVAMKASMNFVSGFCVPVCSGMVLTTNHANHTNIPRPCGHFTQKLPNHLIIKDFFKTTVFW